ncbi:hypothetical protein GCK72_011196 [Caenorhabditis remanei]|uniref:Uncharacterized protein n=1 Tax=Caenorhabditis remanei TaxID=31234 RepID=A0A6A5H951_CAERE|nr:hypothetical protein GCK72_011196 [Caenorhabditis remanei]KAF1762932.1 hypothetical protein GCK72_011196 [Caenorhabditis remanei]
MNILSIFAVDLLTIIFACSIAFFCCTIFCWSAANSRLFASMSSLCRLPIGVLATFHSTLQWNRLVDGFLAPNVSQLEHSYGLWPPTAGFCITRSRPFCRIHLICTRFSTACQRAVTVQQGSFQSAITVLADVLVRKTLRFFQIFHDENVAELEVERAADVQIVTLDLVGETFRWAGNYRNYRKEVNSTMLNHKNQKNSIS